MLRRYAVMPAISALSSANGGMPAAGEPALMKRPRSVSVTALRNFPLRSVFLRLPTSPGIAERRKLIGPLLDGLVERARDQRAVRDDLTVGDLSMAMWSFAPIFEATADIAPQAWRRHLQIVLDGMRPDAATPQTARPLAGRQLERAMEALRERYHRRRAAA